MGTEAVDHQKQMLQSSSCLMGRNGNYKHAKHEQEDQWMTMIMGGDGLVHQDTTSSASSSLGHSSISNGSSTSSSELVDDASSSSTSLSSNSPSSSSSNISNGPLFELSDLMEQLPIKRGLSKFYQGKSQSFTSLSRVMSIEDLAKKETPYRKKMKTCKSYGGGLDIKATISKKVSKSSLYSSSSSLLGARRSSFLGTSKPPLIPVQKHF